MYKLVSIVIAGALTVGTVGAVAGSSGTHHTHIAKGLGVAASGQAPTPTATDAPAVGETKFAHAPTSTTSQATSTTAGKRTATKSSTTTGDVQLAPAAHFVHGPEANQPMTATLTISPAHPAVGEKVTFTIHGHDPDAAQGWINEWTYGDGPTVIVDALRPTCDHPDGWTPAPGGPHDWDVTQTWTYHGAGTFHASFNVLSATPGVGGCPDPYASSAVAAGDVTVTPQAIQGSANDAGFTCSPPTAISAVHFEEGQEQPPLDFHVYGGCDNPSEGQGNLRADLTNQTDQTVYFPQGIDVVVHLDHNGQRQDVHVTDPSTTSLAPGQHVELRKVVSVDRTGGYDVTGTVTYAFVPPAAS